MQAQPNMLLPSRPIKSEICFRYGRHGNIKAAGKTTASYRGFHLNDCFEYWRGGSGGQGVSAALCEFSHASCILVP